MKMKTILSICILSMTVAAFAQVPNPSFEIWTSGSPDGWQTSNQPGFTSVLQVNDPHDAISAVQLVTVSGFGFTIGGSIIANGFPQTTVESALHGWYKGSLLNGDKLFATASINDGADNTLVEGASSFSNATSVWQEFVVNTTTSNSGTAATGNITFIMTDATGSVTAITAGSTVTIDDLSWGVFVAVEENNASNFELERIFPNPSSGNKAMMQYHLNQAARVSYEIIDITGTIVYKENLGQQSVGHFRAELPTSLASGTYYVRLTAGNETAAMMWVY